MINREMLEENSQQHGVSATSFVSNIGQGDRSMGNLWNIVD